MQLGPVTKRSGGILGAGGRGVTVGIFGWGCAAGTLEPLRGARVAQW